MRKYYNIITVIFTFLLGALAENWILFMRIKSSEEWNMNMDFIIHSKPVSYLVYGFLGGWFVSGILAAFVMGIEWVFKSAQRGKLFGVVISVGGAFIVGILGFLPYAVSNTKQFGLHIFADRKRKKDNLGIKKDIAGVVFIICSTVVLLVILLKTYYYSYRLIWGGLLLCCFVIFEGIRKMREIGVHDNTDFNDEVEIQRASVNEKWDFMQRSVEGLSEEEKLSRMCEHLSSYISYYLEKKQKIGIIIEGGFFLEEHADGVKRYLYILRARDEEGYISEKKQKVWEYWILLGYRSLEDSLIEDLTEEWMNEFMDEFYEKLYSLYYKRTRAAARGTGYELVDMKTYMC